MRLVGAEGLAIGGAERVGVAGGERAGARPADADVERVAQGVRPGAHDVGDALLERLAGDLRRLALVAADDVVGARERAFRIGRIGGGEAALEDAGEEFADAAARVACRSGPSARTRAPTRSGRTRRRGRARGCADARTDS